MAPAGARLEVMRAIRTRTATRLLLPVLGLPVLCLSILGLTVLGGAGLSPAAAAPPATVTGRAAPSGEALPVALATTGTASADPAGSPATAAPERFSWPLRPRPRVLRGFAPGPYRWSAGHRGVDLRAGAGVDVLAPAAGTVGFSGVVAGRGVTVLLHPGGLRTTYEPVRATLPSGTAVRAGTAFARVDAVPGHCRGATCLHWGAIRRTVSAGDVYLDPLGLLGGWAIPVVLLPLEPWSLPVPPPGALSL